MSFLLSIYLHLYLYLYLHLSIHHLSICLYMRTRRHGACRSRTGPRTLTRPPTPAAPAPAASLPSSLLELLLLPLWLQAYLAHQKLPLSLTCPRVRDTPLQGYLSHKKLPPPTLGPCPLGGPALAASLPARERHSVTHAYRGTSLAPGGLELSADTPAYAFSGSHPKPQCSHQVAGGCLS